MRPMLALLCLCCCACVPSRGWIVLRNDSGRAVQSVAVISPDFRREVFALGNEQSFRIYQDISFRQPWQVRVTFVDGVSRSSEEQVHGGSWNRVVITIEQERTRLEPERLQ